MHQARKTTMKIKLLLIAGICILTTACQNQKNDSQKSVEHIKSAHRYDLPDSLSARRISFVLDLKKSVAQNAWLDFGQKRTEGTLIYFDADRAEVFFPDQKVITALDDYDKHSDDYGLSSRKDSVPYHMEVMISFDNADSAEFFYENPVEQYSSVEEIGNYISSVQSTEMWATMVIHEMFHHYQYNNENYKAYAKSVIGILPFDSRNLVALCQEDEEFLPMIQKENDCLMQAISEGDKDVRDSTG